MWPALDEREWHVVERESHAADERHAYAHDLRGVGKAVIAAKSGALSARHVKLARPMKKLTALCRPLLRPLLLGLQCRCGQDGQACRAHHRRAEDPLRARRADEPADRHLRAEARRTRDGAEGPGRWRHACQAGGRPAGLHAEAAGPARTRMEAPRRSSRGRHGLRREGCRRKPAPPRPRAAWSSSTPRKARARRPRPPTR